MDVILFQGEGRTTVRFIIIKECMLLNENEDKILASNMIACIIVIKAAVTASKRFSRRGKKAANDKEKRKTFAVKDITNLLLAHRHNSIFNGIVNAFSFKGCLCIFFLL